jgi:cobalt-zinc-cadmium resistance protein CzcA
MNKFIGKLVAFSIKNRFFILFMTILIVVGGVMSFLNTPIEAYPDVTNTRIVIISQWPGRSAEEVEKYITIPIETEMNVVPNKTSLRSISLFGLSVVTLIFDDNVEDFYARQNVMNRLTSVNLPADVVPDVQPPIGPTGEIFRYTIESPDKGIRELKTIQDWVIEKNLKKVPGVADVNSFGGEVKTFEISVDPTLLAKYGLTALDVFKAVGNSNINVGGDIIEKSDQAYVVRGIGLINNINELQNVIVNNINGTPILIKNVAQVHESSMPRLGQAGRDDRSDVIEGIVVMRRGENPKDVLVALKEKIADLNEHILPPDIKIKTFYDRTDLVNSTTHTVMHNLTEGVILVTVILLIFLADWRTTVIVAIIIPLALLFAFILMKWKGMSANLLSMGAIDFGIIIDGAVVMVEGIFAFMAHKSEHIGMESFNRRAKMGWIKGVGTEMGKPIFFSKLIIITALLPIFAFQKVEGKMFSPLAYTIGFALLGALLFTLTLVPMLCSVLLKKNVRERDNPVINFFNRIYNPVIDKVLFKPKRAVSIAVGVLVVGLFCFTFLGTEFLPHLDEGSIYVRASMPMSISLSQSAKYSQDIRNIFRSFPEVRGVISQTGRPNDGTDPTGFFNNEFFVDTYPKEEWKSGLTKDQLIDKMQAKLEKYPGVIFGFSQPISDNVEEAVSGVKGSMAIKIFGDDLRRLEKMADTVKNVMAHIRGVEDLGVFKNIGQPEVDIDLDQLKMASYGVSTADANAVIEMALGGKAASQLYEGERKFDIRIRYLPQYRYSEEQVANLLVPTQSGTRIPLKEIANIKLLTGPAFIYREDNRRFIALKFSVRGRDLGGTIQEAQKKVNKTIHLPRSYSMSWNGEFENQQRATKRLSYVVPISIILIFILLFIMFGSALEASIVLMNVPFALIGGILALLLTRINFSISAGVGFIALFGVCVQNGVILVSVFKKNLHDGMSLIDAVKEGAKSRLRPVIMTALMAMLGLLPAALSTGIGSETQKPLAVVVIGGLISATILVMVVLPAIYVLVYRNKHGKNNKLAVQH